MNRYFIKTSFAKILLLLAVSLSAKEPIRTWTSADGRNLEARYLEMVGTKVRIENASGRKFTVPLTGFSLADQEYAKLAYERSLFAIPQPFDGDGRGGVIVASAKGRVEVLVPPRGRYSDEKPAGRAVIVGESIASGATLTTGSGSSADLLLTNGTLAHLGESTKLVLSALFQKSFKGTKQKASDLTREVSPSRTSLKLEEGDLVVEVRKLNKESSFLISTPIAHAGIRGTQFKVKASADSAELSVLEGRVDFLDAEQLATSVETAQKAGARKGVPAKLEDMSASEQAEVKQVVEQTKQASVSIDLNRLANTVDGYEPKPNYIVKSALDMELIWCRPGGFMMGEPGKATPVIMEYGFYLGKYEITKEQYFAIYEKPPPDVEQNKFPAYMSWNQASNLCDILNEKEKNILAPGWSFVIPSNKEWEYACRAGTTTRFFWGDQKGGKRANVSGVGGKVLPVGSFPPNFWGFYDMHGNLFEWNSDQRGENKTLRGGSYTHPYEFATSYRISSQPADYRHPLFGLRVGLRKLE